MREDESCKFYFIEEEGLGLDGIPRQTTSRGCLKSRGISWESSSVVSCCLVMKRWRSSKWLLEGVSDEGTVEVGSWRPNMWRRDGYHFWLAEWLDTVDNDCKSCHFLACHKKKYWTRYLKRITFYTFQLMIGLTWLNVFQLTEDIME